MAIFYLFQLKEYINLDNFTMELSLILYAVIV